MPEPSLRELLSSSGLAFTGTVEAVGATTMADVPVVEFGEDAGTDLAEVRGH